MNSSSLVRTTSLLFFLSLSILSFSQDLYTARGYWEETTKSNYQVIKKKQISGDSLSTNEKLYLSDYETHLSTYYGRLSDSEKNRYQEMKPVWDRELKNTVAQQEYNPLEGRKKNFFSNGFYGLYYGISLVAIADIDNAGIVGIPLITSGLSMMGPLIRPKKYEIATPAAVRAGNTGRMLGLGYGLALAWAINGNDDGTGKLALGLSSLGSIALGEAGFYLQKKKNFTMGHIDLVRHYNFLGAWSALALAGATGTDHPNVFGASLLAGGVSGFLIGNKAAKKYDYSRGDVDAISSLTLITTGLGFTAVIETLQNNSNPPDALILVPAATSVAGTLIAQRAVKGAHFTDKQGAIIHLSTAGSALIGLGIVALTEADSPTLYVGIPSALALVTHQVLFHKFKTRNIERSLQSSDKKKWGYKFSFKATPENYFINKMMLNNSSSIYTSSSRMQNPLATLRITF